MSKTVDEVIMILAKTFRKRFEDFKGIYLFGTFLDGKPHEDEDIELVALFDIEDQSKREEIWPLIGKIETDLGVCIDLYPYTEQQFKDDEELYKEVMTNGVFYNIAGLKDIKK